MPALRQPATLKTVRLAFNTARLSRGASTGTGSGLGWGWGFASALAMKHVAVSRDWKILEMVHQEQGKTDKLHSGLMLNVTLTSSVAMDQK